jgi:hypothetical protein
VEFFHHFSKTAEGVPASNMWNYDETNFKDDLGTDKSIFKEGTKYAERVMNSTKSAVFVMFCGSAGQCCWSTYENLHSDPVKACFRFKKKYIFGYKIPVPGINLLENIQNKFDGSATLLYRYHQVVN